MATRIKLRRDTAANWLTSNPILAQGETGFETDTRMVKLGDGTTRWADLKYAVTGNLKVTDNTIHGDDVVSISSGKGDRSNWIMTVNAVDGPDSASAYTTAVAYDSDGNTFSTSVFAGPGGGESGMTLIKTDASGEVLFKKYYNGVYAFGWSMIVDQNDDVILVLAEFDPAAADTILAKVSGTDGTIVWQKYLADTDSASNDVAVCVDIDPSNNIIIAGTTATAPSGVDFWVAKFNNETGASIWQRQYDGNGWTDSATGIAVDSEGNIGVVGTTDYDGNLVLSIFKVAGTDGDVIWQKRINNINVQANEEGYGGAWTNYDIYSSDICVDSDNNFYFSVTANYGDSPLTAAGVHKFTSAGLRSWSKVIGLVSYFSGSSSLICDSQNNVYLTSTLLDYHQANQSNSVPQYATVITKFNASGRKIWGKSLMHEQGTAYAGGGANTSLIGVGQTVAVNDNYILVGGGYYVTGDYGTANQYWENRPYLAQLDKGGTDFVQDGWLFKDNGFKIYEMTAATDDAGEIADLTELTADIEVTTANLTFTADGDTTTLTYINTSRAKTMTLDGDRLHLPENGGLALSRKHIGHYTSIGKFDLDGNEGNNIGGGTWINGVDIDAEGSVYAAGGWYTTQQWNDGNSGQEIPLVYKIDSEGNLVWQAGNNLNQWGADMVDVAVNSANGTVVAMGHDYELDGHEGFNVITLDAGSGAMKSIQHIRPTGTTSEGDNEDLYPRALSLLSDGTPVVVGYLNSASDKFANVTNGGAGGVGSDANGVLVVNKSVFVRSDDISDIEYPNNSGNWYVGGAVIAYVNSYASLASVNTTTAGTGVKFDVLTADDGLGGFTLTITPSSGFNGSGYRVGNYFKILGTDIGGVSPDNDLLFRVATIDGSGGVLTTGSITWSNTGYTAYGAYPDAVKTPQVGTGATFTVVADPKTRAYGVSRIAGGQYYAVGDTVKVLGSLLGGVDGVNDALITVATETDGAVNTITNTGLGQNVTIKLDVNSAVDYTQADTYNIWHETSDDAFIWVGGQDGWHAAIGGESNSDYFNCVAIDSDDNIIAGGRSDNLGLGSGTTNWGSNSQTAFIAKYSSAGERQWIKAVDGHEGNNEVWGVTTDTDDNIYAIMSSGPGGLDPVVIKLSSTGAFVWQVQLDYYQNWSSTWSIAIDASENIIISGETESNDTDQARVGGNNNIHLAKFDRDGNVLWQRMLWSNNGMYNSYNDWYGHSLAIAGNKFVWGGVSNPWNDDNNDIALLAQLPIDGTGLGRNGNYTYDEIEVSIDRWVDNAWDGPSDTYVTDVTSVLPTRQHTLVDEPYTNDQPGDDGYPYAVSGPMTIYADLRSKIEHILKEGGGDITGVKEIVFEDGTKQSTSSQDIPQVDISINNSWDHGYWLQLADRGKHIFVDEYGDDIVIPPYSAVPFPVGTSIVIVTGDTTVNIRSYDADDYMRYAGANAASYSWQMPSYSMVTLLKIRQSFNPDGSGNDNGEWMIAGPGLTDNNI